MYLYDKNGTKIGEIYDKYLQPKQSSSKIFTTKEKLREIFYDATPERIDEFYETFSEFADVFNITTEFHENAFLAQIVAETGYSLIPARENLNYSCEALKKIFSYYKKHTQEAMQDGRCNGHRADQVAIGNKAYANRIGNGNVESGDGYKFRGGGFIQLTGRGNYERMAEIISKLIEKPISADFLAENITSTGIGLLSAMAFWADNACDECDNIDCVTKKVNRYTDTYQKRKKLYKWIANL